MVYFCFRNLQQSRQPATSKKTIKILITKQNTVHGYNLLQTSICKKHQPTTTNRQSVKYRTVLKDGIFLFFSKLNLLQSKQPATSRKTIKKKFNNVTKILYMVTIQANKYLYATPTVSQSVKYCIERRYMSFFQEVKPSAKYPQLVGKV
jgi:hypothetical protein